MECSRIEALARAAADMVVLLALFSLVPLAAVLVIGAKAGFDVEQSIALLGHLPSALAYLFGL